MQIEPPRPRGRDEVMAAVRAAAVELLAERGPREISVRDVAELAGVNHALVHRHFGTKEELLRSVVREQSAAVGAAALALPARDVASVLHQLREYPAYWRILARAVLDAPEILAPGEASAAAGILALISRGGEPDADARLSAAVAGSLALGWIVFGAHLSAVLDVPDGELLEAAVAEGVARLLEPRGQ